MSLNRESRALVVLSDRKISIHFRNSALHPLSVKEEKKKQLKQDEKAHLAQAKADKLQRKALDNVKTQKAEKAQLKADRKIEKTTSEEDLD